MRIIKSELEQMPKVKLIGKRYTEKDRDQYNTFSGKWEQWFTNNWFAQLQGEGGLQGISDDYIGLIHCCGGTFEYYIGVFMAPDDPVPEGFDAVTLEAAEVFVCYLYGNEQSGELYGEEAAQRSMAMFKASGCSASPDGWQFERYNCRRFTEPDDKGCVILDIGIYTAD